MPGAVEPRVRWVEMRGVIEKTARTKPIRGYGTVLDITDRKTTEHAMERLAFYDSLTGLPNRTNGRMLAQQMLDQARRRQAWRSLCCLWTSTASGKSTTPMATSWVTTCLSELADLVSLGLRQERCLCAWGERSTYKLAPGEPTGAAKRGCSTRSAFRWCSAA